MKAVDETENRRCCPRYLNLCFWNIFIDNSVIYKKVECLNMHKEGMKLIKCVLYEFSYWNKKLYKEKGYTYSIASFRE